MNETTLENIRLQIILEFLVQVDARDVPHDEGNGDALFYNLWQLAQHGRPYEAYEYLPWQDAECDRLLRDGLVKKYTIGEFLDSADDWK